jgi:hypothetical protein
MLEVKVPIIFSGT